MARMLHGEGSLGLGAMAHCPSSNSTQARRSPGLSLHRARPRPVTVRRWGCGAAVVRRPTDWLASTVATTRDNLVSVQLEVGITARQWVRLNADNLRRTGAARGSAWRTAALGVPSSSATRYSRARRQIRCASGRGAGLLSREITARCLAASVQGPEGLPRRAAQGRR